MKKSRTKNATKTNIKQFTNCRDFMDNLGNKLGFKNLKDWYCITTKAMTSNGGVTIINRYGGSPLKVLQAVYFHEWIPWKFSTVPKGYWGKWENQRNFIDWLGSALGFKEMEAWYHITLKEIIQHRGSFLINDKYYGSPSKLIQSVYPSHEWLIWRFDIVPKGYWNSLENQKQFMKWLEKKLHISNVKEWYRISMGDITRFSSRSLVDNYSLAHLLSTIYPNHAWNLEKLANFRKFSMKSSQRILLVTIQEIFPLSGEFKC
jgi:hypothetical protein